MNIVLIEESPGTPGQQDGSWSKEEVDFLKVKRFVITDFWVCIKVWSATSGLQGVFGEVRGRNLE